MKTSTISYISALVVCFQMFVFSSLKAQFNTDTSMNIEYLVKEVFLTKSVKVSNISYTGHIHSIGYFNNRHGTFNIPQGIVLSTGNVNDAKGPNTAENTGIPNFKQGDKDLRNIARGQTFDAAILEFDFIPSSDTVTFRYVFASEEYPEYVGSRYNDVFAFFLSGPGIRGSKNLAVLPGATTPITVNNINDKTNKHLYVDNNQRNTKFGQLTASLRGERYERKAENSLQFDGYTKVLTAKSAVIPYKTYHIKIAIADVGDMIYDSGVFLEAGSFKSYKEESETITNFISSAETGGIDITETATDDDPPITRIILNINFEFDKANIPDSSLKHLQKVYDILAASPDSKVEVYGYTDNFGSMEYNIDLSNRRAGSVSDYLVQCGINEKRIYAEGKGYNYAIADNDTPEGRARNRRVEFVIHNTKYQQAMIK